MPWLNSFSSHSLVSMSCGNVQEPGASVVHLFGEQGGDLDVRFGLVHGFYGLLVDAHPVVPVGCVDGPLLEERGHRQHDVRIVHRFGEELFHRDDHFQRVEGFLKLGTVEVLGEGILARHPEHFQGGVLGVQDGLRRLVDVHGAVRVTGGLALGEIEFTLGACRSDKAQGAFGLFLEQRVVVEAPRFAGGRKRAPPPSLPTLPVMATRASMARTEAPPLVCLCIP